MFGLFNDDILLWILIIFLLLGDDKHKKHKKHGRIRAEGIESHEEIRED